MSWLFGFFLTFVVGGVGFFLFRFLRVPNPALLGSMAATGALNIAGFYPSLNTRGVSFLANVMIGVMLGRQIDRNVLRRFRALVRPVMMQVVGMLVLSLICGVTMYLMGGVSFPTALVSGAAGGITEMVAFGMSIDANVAVIAFVQLFRIVIFLALIPWLSVIAGKVSGVPSDRRSTTRSESRENARAAPFAPGDYGFLPLLALAGAALGIRLRIPAGAMLGAMFSCGIFAICLDKRYVYDNRLRWVAQIVLGLVMGQRMTPQIVGQLRTLFFPALVVTGVMLVGCTLLAILLYKTSDWDLTTCLLCSAPAGLTQIVTFAEEIGVDSFTASVFHTARIIGIVGLYPWLILPLTAGG